MILDFKQKTDNCFQQHTFEISEHNNKENVFCHGTIQSDMMNLFVDFCFNDEKIFIHFDENEHRINLEEQPMKQKSGFGDWYAENEYMNAFRTRYYDQNGSVIATIKRQRVEHKVLWAQKFLISYRGSQYTAFFVAKAFKGRYYFIVDENSQTVGAIKQFLWSRNNIFNYTIFATDKFYAKLATLFLIYADNFEYGGRRILREGGLLDIKGETTLVAQPKEVKSYYDPDFIQYVKNMEKRNNQQYT